MIYTKAFELDNASANSIRAELHELMITAEQYGDFGPLQIWVPRTQDALDMLQTFKTNGAFHEYLWPQTDAEKAAEREKLRTATKNTYKPSKMKLDEFTHDELGFFDQCEVIMKDGLTDCIILVCEARKLSKAEELQKLRKTDDTAFICVTCEKITTGFGARIGIGWACNSDCYEAECKRLWALEESKVCS